MFSTTTTTVYFKLQPDSLGQIQEEIKSRPGDGRCDCAETSPRKNGNNHT